jgi:hypothetical protein
MVKSKGSYDMRLIAGTNSELQRPGLDNLLTKPTLFIGRDQSLFQAVEYAGHEFFHYVDPRNFPIQTGADKLARELRAFTFQTTIYQQLQIAYPGYSNSTSDFLLNHVNNGTLDSLIRPIYQSQMDILDGKP